MATNATNLIGVNTALSSAKPQFALGTVALVGNKPYTYVKAGLTHAASAVVEVSASTFVTEAGTGFTVPAALTDGVPSGEYFWIAQTATPFYTASA